ncbi:MAG: hypothetical protein ABFD89_09975 [Bryobacteraceae bacterium]
MKISGTKTDNNPEAFAAKVGIRENVLQLVKPSRVFDAFCGTGKMYREVWAKADAYVGCDSREWLFSDPPRFMADNHDVMRSIDLQQFNIFDFDSYGSPWDQVLILAARRRWRKGEIGGLILTDGSSLKTRMGGLPFSLATLAGLDSASKSPSTHGNIAISKLALAGFLRRSNLEITHAWEADGATSSKMVYSGIVFQSKGSK